MTDLTIEYLGMSDQQLEPEDDTDITLLVTNNTDCGIILKSVVYTSTQSGIDFRAFNESADSLYANPKRIDMTDLRSSILPPRRTTELAVTVRTQNAMVGENPIRVIADYEFSQPDGSCEADVVILVSPD